MLKMRVFFFRDLIKGFYAKSKQEIMELVSQYQQLDSAVKAKSDLYKMCIYHNNIKGIGYDTTNNFPIKRSDFIYFLSDDIIRKEDEISKYCELVIKKPVTIEKDLKWSFIDKNTRENFNAQLEDIAFKQAFLSGFTPIKESRNPDIIIAKVKSIKTIINGYKEISEYFVEEVYKFNDKILKTLPDNFEVNKELVEDNDQLNMFQ